MPRDLGLSETSICGVVCECGRNGEPLACGFSKGHLGAHAWATLPTFVNGQSTEERELRSAVNEVYGSYQSLLSQLRYLGSGGDRWDGPVVARRVLGIEESDWEAERRRAEGQEG